MDTRKDRWIHGKMVCETCMYYVPKKGKVGRCRRHAPTMEGWPAVYGDTDWCGDHKLHSDRGQPKEEGD